MLSNAFRKKNVRQQFCDFVLFICFPSLIAFTTVGVRGDEGRGKGWGECMGTLQGEKATLMVDVAAPLQ